MALQKVYNLSAELVFLLSVVVDLFSMLPCHRKDRKSYGG